VRPQPHRGRRSRGGDRGQRGTRLPFASGTIRLYGAPAEEIYHGGVYMVREGLFSISTHSSSGTRRRSRP
jgi:hypothetical protein